MTFGFGRPTMAVADHFCPFDSRINCSQSFSCVHFLSFAHWSFGNYYYWPKTGNSCGLQLYNYFNYYVNPWVLILFCSTV